MLLRSPNQYQSVVQCLAYVSGYKTRFFSLHYAIKMIILDLKVVFTEMWDICLPRLFNHKLHDHYEIYPTTCYFLGCVCFVNTFEPNDGLISFTTVVFIHKCRTIYDILGNVNCWGLFCIDVLMAA